MDCRVSPASPHIAAVPHSGVGGGGNPARSSEGPRSPRAGGLRAGIRPQRGEV